MNSLPLYTTPIEVEWSNEQGSHFLVAIEVKAIDRTRLLQMAQRARTLAQPRAAQRVADELLREARAVNRLGAGKGKHLPGISPLDFDGRRFHAHWAVPKGFGEAKPVASNDSPTGRQQQRRQEKYARSHAHGFFSTVLPLYL